MATVLIIDDRHVNREYLGSILKYMNHESIMAHNGKEGLVSVALHRPDLVITDILMPQMDGYEFVSHLKQDEKFKDIPIVFYTANYRKEEAEAYAEKLGIFQVLAKPADPQTIIDTIQTALKSQETLQTEDLEKSQVHEKFKSNLYRAPHEMFNAAGRLHHFNERINKIHQILSQSSDTLAAEKPKILELINDISDDLSLYRKVNSDLFSLIELTFEMIEEKNAHKLLQLYCHGARNAVNASSGVAVIFGRPECSGFQVTSGAATENKPIIPLLYNAKGAIIDNNNVLYTPIVTASKLYGYAYFVNPKVNIKFSDHDIRILDTLTSELSIFYENIALFELVKEKSARLELESAKLKASTEELEKSEIIFRQFAENIKDVFWRTTSNLDKVIYISPGYEEIWGKSTESIYLNPCSWQENILDEDKAKVAHFVSQIKETQSNGTIEYRIKRPDGAIRNIYNKTICLKDDEGQLTHLIGIASDITEYLQSKKGITLEYSLSRILERDSSPIQVMPQVLQLVCEIFEWEMGEFWLMDENMQHLRNVHIWPRRDRNFAKLEKISINHIIKSNEDLPGRALTTRDVCWVGDYELHTVPARAKLVLKLQLRNAISIPLLYQNNVVGVMNFLSQRESIPSDNLSKILITLGMRIGEFFTQKTTQEQLMLLAKRGSNRIIF